MSLNTELLAESFSKLRSREDEFTSCFYATLFENYPQVKPLFASTHMDVQAKKLFASLEMVVSSLDNSEALSQGVRALGTRHVKYGVLPEYYPMVGSALLSAMATTLEGDWNAAVAQAWTEAYGAITALALEGADYPEEILRPSA